MRTISRALAVRNRAHPPTGAGAKFAEFNSEIQKPKTETRNPKIEPQKNLSRSLTVRTLPQGPFVNRAHP